MSEKFQKGQLVAVNCPAEDDRQWHLRIFKEKRPDGHFVAEDDKREAWAWQVCRPAEEVWPDIFLGRLTPAAANAVAMESELVQRLRKQIRWLCRQIQSIADIEELGNVCPPVGMSPYYNNCQCNCIACWEQASLKAVEEGADGKRDS